MLLESYFSHGALWNRALPNGLNVQQKLDSLILNPQCQGEMTASLVAQIVRCHRNACDSDSRCGLACDASTRDAKLLAVWVERCEPLRPQEISRRIPQIFYSARSKQSFSADCGPRLWAFRAPLPAEWIFRHRFSRHACISQRFCREFRCGFLCGFSVLCLKGQRAPRNPHQKNHTKIHNKIHALRMKIHHDECSAEGQSWSIKWFEGSNLGKVLWLRLCSFKSLGLVVICCIIECAEALIKRCFRDEHT